MSELRTQLRLLVQQRWDGNETAAARAIGVKQPSLRAFLRGGNAGLKIIRGCARLLPREVALEVGLPVAPLQPMPNLDEAVAILDGRYEDASVDFLQAAGAHFTRDMPVGDWIELARMYEQAHKVSEQSRSA